LRLDELFQLSPQFHGHFAAAATVTTRDRDGGAIGLHEVETGRTVAQMLVELPLHFGVERSLGVIEEKALNVPAAKPCAEELPNAIHNHVDAGVRSNDSLKAAF
jgi:hypothetical protein